MTENKEKMKELPENAYRELKQGEEYKPVLPADKPVTEVTAWSVGMGLLMAVIFSAAAAYSGLKIGQVFEAAYSYFYYRRRRIGSVKKKERAGTKRNYPVHRGIIGCYSCRSSFYHSGALHSASQIS